MCETQNVLLNSRSHTMTNIIKIIIQFFSRPRISHIEQYVNSQQLTSTADVDRAGREFFQRDDNYTWGL